MSPKERKNVTDEDILYEFYSLDSLKYHIDMLSQLKLRIQQILPKSDPLYEKRYLLLDLKLLRDTLHYLKV
jgi:hypothetical protein